MTLTLGESPTTYGELVAEIESHYAMWLAAVLPRFCSSPLAEHHRRFWDHIWTIRLGLPARPFVAVWPRGGAKSTSLEGSCVALGARGARRYGIYVCRTQDQANDHVATVGAMLESPEMAAYYPQMAERAVGKYGASKGWSRTRLRTASGFTLDAVGLDTAARGLKIEDQRPDLIILDDLDEENDTAATVRKLENLLTKKILQVGSVDVIVLAGQNLIHDDGIFARLIRAQAGYLVNAIRSGPVPAVIDPELMVGETPDGDRRDLLVGGTPTWAGMDLAACQAKIDEVGLSAWLSEAQHDTEPPPGGMFSHLDFAEIEVTELPPLVRTVVWCDPAVTSSDQSDANGVVVDALGVDGRLYGLFAWEARSSPVATLKLALRQALTWNAQYVGVETDQGGDTWLSVVREAKEELARELIAEGDEASAARIESIGFRDAKAGTVQTSKAGRAQRFLLPHYERGRIRHLVGSHTVRQRALRRFPLLKPYDLVDACAWSAKDLLDSNAARTNAGAILGRR